MEEVFVGEIYNTLLDPNEGGGKIYFSKTNENNISDKEAWLKHPHDDIIKAKLLVSAEDQSQLINV